MLASPDPLVTATVQRRPRRAELGFRRGSTPRKVVATVIDSVAASWQVLLAANTRVEARRG